MEINVSEKRTFLDQGHGDGATTTKAIPERDLPVLSLPSKNRKPILNINLYFTCLKISKLTLLYKITEILEKTEHKLYLHTSPTERQPRARRRRLSPKRVIFSKKNVSRALELVVTGKLAAGSPRAPRAAAGSAGDKGLDPGETDALN